MSTQNLTTFLDSLGRTIIAESVPEATTNTHLAVKNPVIVHIVPVGNNGQMTVQLLPVFFREFLADKSEDTTWKYNREFITETDAIVFDFKLSAQYQQMFAKSNLVVSSTTTEDVAAPSPDVVKLFDE